MFRLVSFLSLFRDSNFQVALTFPRKPGSAEPAYQIDGVRFADLTVNVEYRQLESKIKLAMKDLVGSAVYYLKTGKVIITGCMSMLEAKKFARRILRLVQRCYDPDLQHLVKWKACTFAIINIAADGSLGFNVNLNWVMKRYWDCTPPPSFEPEDFPSVRWRPFPNASVSVSIFANGKFTLTGAKTEIQVNETFQWLFEKLETCSASGRLPSEELRNAVPVDTAHEMQCRAYRINQRKRPAPPPIVKPELRSVASLSLPPHLMRTKVKIDLTDASFQPCIVMVAPSTPSVKVEVATPPPVLRLPCFMTRFRPMASPPPPPLESAPKRQKVPLPAPPTAVPAIQVKMEPEIDWI